LSTYISTLADIANLKKDIFKRWILAFLERLYIVFRNDSTQSPDNHLLKKKFGNFAMSASVKIDVNKCF
jgi:hypothetical protein